MGKIKNFFGKVLAFFGIEIFKVNLESFYEIEEEITHIQATASTDIALFKQEAFTNNIIDNMKTLLKDAKKQTEFLDKTLLDTAKDVLKLAEQSIIPWLRAHIDAKHLTKDAKHQLEKDLTIALELFIKFREDWDEVY